MIDIETIEQLNFTNIKQVNYSQSFTGLKNGLTCFISYKTIIGMYDIDNRQAVFTDYYYSKATSRHRNKFMKEYNGVIDNNRFNTLLNKYGLND